jgi:hypothetical protein
VGIYDSQSQGGVVSAIQEHFFCIAEITFWSGIFNVGTQDGVERGTKFRFVFFNIAETIFTNNFFSRSYNSK